MFEGDTSHRLEGDTGHIPRCALIISLELRRESASLPRRDPPFFLGHMWLIWLLAGARSFSIVCWEMCTGQQAWVNLDYKQMLAAVVRDRKRPPMV